MKRCTKCKRLIEKDGFYKDSSRFDGLNSICRTCAAEKDRKYREKNKDYLIDKRRVRYGHTKKSVGIDLDKLKIRKIKYINKNREKINARSLLHYYAKNGLINKYDICQLCGSSEKIEAHHPDYGKPLDVIWVCFKCHRKRF